MSSRNPLHFIISTMLILFILAFAWRLVLAAIVVAAVVGIFIFARNRFHARSTARAQESPQAEIFRDNTSHPERKILRNVEEQDF